MAKVSISIYDGSNWQPVTSDIVKRGTVSPTDPNSGVNDETMLYIKSGSGNLATRIYFRE